MRLVISYVTTQTDKLCKFLNVILPAGIDFQSKYSIKNSLHLITKIEYQQKFFLTFGK